MKFVHRVGIFFAAFFLGASSIFAQTPVPSISLPVPIMTKNDYVLPYPGILPDHPLYILKRARDRILDFLIIDPLRKAEFYILQADKRLGMGALLFDKGKEGEAMQSIMQGEKYLFQASENLITLKNSSKEIPGYIIERLTKASIKHKEVLTEMFVKASGVQSSLDVLKKTIEDIAKLK